jgi:3-methyl-2-oxobutanoate hydroxymethyltransferase
VFGIIFQAIPGRLGEYITNKLQVPTIGIGSGAGCDGQLLILHDMLGLFERFAPGFSRKYLDLAGVLGETFDRYARDVRTGVFPTEEHTSSISDEIMSGIETAFGSP